MSTNLIIRKDLTVEYGSVCVDRQIEDNYWKFNCERIGSREVYPIEGFLSSDDFIPMQSRVNA